MFYLCACLARGIFAAGRLVRRTSTPLPIWRRWIFFVATSLHLLSLLTDIAITFVLASDLWCIEPLSGTGGGFVPALNDAAVDAAQQRGRASGEQGGALSAELFIPSTCTYVPFVLYLSLPPGAFILPSLLGMAAVASQSARGLRLYGAWNGASVWSAAVALVITSIYMQVLGVETLILPYCLIALKLFCAQCVPIELAEIETSRPIRGWRGLFEVRNGPTARCLAELKLASSKGRK